MSWQIAALVIIAAIFAALYAAGILAHVLVVCTTILLLLLFYKLCIRKFGPYESALIYRFGRFHRASPAGWTLIIPFIERIGAVVDLREQKTRIVVPAITKEGLKVNLSAIVYFFVNNASRVILNVQDYRSSLKDLIESRIRDIAGEFSLSQLIINIEDISKALHKDITTALQRWGVSLSMLELERVEPPADLMEAIEEKEVSQQMLEAKKFAAEARKILVDALGEGTKHFDDKTIAYLYIKALENMKSSKMMIPTEFLNVVKGNGSNSGAAALAKGMIAGTTFNKALTAISNEAAKKAKLNPVEIEYRIHGKESPAEETAREIDNPEDLDQESDFVGDSLNRSGGNPDESTSSHEGQ